MPNANPPRPRTRNAGTKQSPAARIPPAQGPWDRRTPAQRLAYEKAQARDTAVRAGICNALKFWLRCHDRRCRRQRACSGDPHACFRRHWALYSEEEKVWLRAGIKARVQGLSPQDAALAANAELARHLALMEKHAPQPAPAPPPKQPGDGTPPRVRGL
jgi:hypothetical protein